MKLTYTKGNENNPFNGEIRDADGNLYVIRAVMNKYDDEAMRVMAAAPDLLEACETMLARWKSDIIPPAEKFGGCVGLLRAAIAKAKGGI